MGDGAAYRALRKAGPSPASVIWVEGKPVFDPARIDERFRQAWRAIYDGSSRPHEEVVRSFFAKYEGDIYAREPYVLQPVTAHDLWLSATHAAKTAGGLD
eukprot:5767618-Lingulodinium_polyedra.AAC.1